MCKVVKSFLPKIFPDIFQFRQQQNHKLSQNSQFRIPRVRSVYNGTESISCLGPHIRNLVPASFKELTSLKLLKWIIHFCHEFFTCSSSNCRARLQTNLFNVDDPQQIIVHNVNIHNQPPNLEAAQRRRLVQQMRDQIREDPAQRVHQIYFDVLVNEAAAAQNQEPVNLRYDRIRSQLNRARNALLPRIPRAADQVIIQYIWTQTWTGWYISFKILEIRT